MAIDVPPAHLAEPLRPAAALALTALGRESARSSVRSTTLTRGSPGPVRANQIAEIVGHDEEDDDRDGACETVVLPLPAANASLYV